MSGVGSNGEIRRTALFVYSTAQTEYLSEPRRPELSLQVVPPLGFLYLAAVLREYGIDCSVMDRTVAPYLLDDIVAFIDEERPVFVGFYSDVTTCESVCGWIRGVRFLAKGIPILVGGPNASVPEPYLEAGATMVCMGEGEGCIRDMVDAIDGRRDPATIKGIAYMKDGAAVRNERLEFIQDLDSLPFPRRDIIDIGDCHDWRVVNMRTPYTTMITSRGCEHGCTFCSVPHIAGHRLRRRTPANVLAEIDEVVKDHKIRYIAFKDNYFASDPEWEKVFCDGLIERKYDLLWSCQTHPFVFEKERAERLARFAKAGCDLIILGVHSADPNVLRLARRSVREPTSARLTVAAARKVGINTALEFSFGLPGSSRESMLADLRFAIDARPRYATFDPVLRLDPSELNDSFGRDGDTCGMSSDELNLLAVQAWRQFYMDVKVVLPTAVYVLTHNPAWLRYGLKYLRSQFLPKRQIKSGN